MPTRRQQLVVHGLESISTKVASEDIGLEVEFPPETNIIIEFLLQSKV